MPAPRRWPGRGRTTAVMIGLAALAVGVVGAAGSAAASSLARTSENPLLVQVSDGLLQGAATNSSGRLFADIPYAAPPVGALRWKAPQPAARWSGVRAATTPGPICAQGSTFGLSAGSSEDCLTLNVYTPPTAAGRSRAASLPVMVFIHGGAFTSGAGSQYDGSVLAAKGDVDVVTINYRLGPFGWLVNPALDAESPGGASGDYGLMDQQAALRWVQRNIGSFGGNGHDVTIFGQSAGGGSVCSQLASPSAKGLFQRAIAESGCSSLDIPAAKADATGATIATQLGCTDTLGSATEAACLRSKTPAQLLAAPAASGLPGPFAPVTGTKVEPRDILTAFKTGRFNRVPVVNGSNHDEATFLVNLFIGTVPNEAAYEFILGQQQGANAAKVLAEYPASNYPTLTNALAATMSDSQFICPALQDDAALKTRTLTWSYEFNDPNPPAQMPAGFPLGDYHTAELQYLFQRTSPGDQVPAFTPAQLVLSNQMIAAWTQFARYGVLTGVGQSFWPEDLTGDAISLTSTGSTPLPLSTIATEHHCAFWDSLPAA
jgi:para-nitrobenzyl esterase